MSQRSEPWVVDRLAAAERRAEEEARRAESAEARLQQALAKLERLEAERR